MGTINSLPRPAAGLRRACLSLLALVFGLPALGQESAYPDIRQQRTLQDVARELKLKPKEDRKPGTVSALESTLSRAPGMSWDQIIESNEAYLEALRGAGRSRDESILETPVIADDYVGYGVNGSGYRPRASRRPVLAPRPTGPRLGLRASAPRGLARWSAGWRDQAQLPR